MTASAQGRVQVGQTWTDGDYPTEAALERIEQWDSRDIAGCLDFVASIWHGPDYGVSHDLRPEEADVVDCQGRFLRLATGGWSGNESIISALRSNRLISAFSWRLSAAGGLHIYQYPREASE